eukprot:scaffold2968_cov321-Pinguiococcus_pyrenoidosus.AAC.14
MPPQGEPLLSKIRKGRKIQCLSMRCSPLSALCKPFPLALLLWRLLLCLCARGTPVMSLRVAVGQLRSTGDPLANFERYKASKPSGLSAGHIPQEKPKSAVRVCLDLWCPEGVRASAQRPRRPGRSCCVCPSASISSAPTRPRR